MSTKYGDTADFIEDQRYGESLPNITDAERWADMRSEHASSIPFDAKSQA
jgi:hypothetical protein